MLNVVQCVQCVSHSGARLFSRSPHALFFDPQKTLTVQDNVQYSMHDLFPVKHEIELTFSTCLLIPVICMKESYEQKVQFKHIKYVAKLDVKSI